MQCVIFSELHYLGAWGKAEAFHTGKLFSTEILMNT